MEKKSLSITDQRKFELGTEKLQVLGRLQAIGPIKDNIVMDWHAAKARLEMINDELQKLGEGQQELPIE
jgi:hypothetical protein